MLNREKTFTCRGHSAKPNRVMNLYRPSSSKSKTQYSSIKINTSVSSALPPPIFTMPNNRKLTSGMGNSIEREELYENNIQLRESLNKLEMQLKKSKYLNVKNELELRKKEKLIQNFVDENSKEIKDENKIISLKESALITKFKNKYNKLQLDYEKLKANTQILEANKKLTNIKEYQIENGILNEELKKIKILYQNSKKYHEKYDDISAKLKEMKIKFSEQHIIILNYEEKMKELNQNIVELKDENANLKKKLEFLTRKKEKLNIRNKILVIKNKKLLENKKLKESFEFEQNTYKKNYEKQKKEIADLKSALNIRISDIQSLQETCNAYKKLLETKDNNAIEPIDYNKFKNFEKRINPPEMEKMLLYKSLYDESQKKIEIYEKFLNKSNIMPKNILSKSGFDGVLNSGNNDENNRNDTNQKINISNNFNENNNKDFDNKTDGGFSYAKTKAYTNNNNQTNNEANTDKSEDNQLLDNENSYLQLIIKNLEAKKVTSEIMLNKIEDIKNHFMEKNDKVESKSLSIDEFISPFLNMLIETMKITQESDKEQIKIFLEEYLGYVKNNTNDFITLLVNAFEKIIDYDKLENPEMLLNSLAFNLQKYKKEIIDKLKQIDKNNTKLISFKDFSKLLSELNNPLHIETLEYLLFKMKENVDESCSIFDFNYNIILELLERKIPDDFEDFEDDGEFDESNIISNILSQFKNNMQKDNVNLEKACKDKVKKFNVNNKNIEVISKNDFFEIMEKYDISLDEQIKEIIYKFFIVEEPECTQKGKIQMMDFDKLNNLFTNNEYKEENN